MKALILGVFLVVSSLLQGIHTTQPLFPRATNDVYEHPRLLVVGDGLSVGYDATDAQHGYVSLLARALHAQLAMHAVAGALTPDLYADLQRDLPAQADIIVVELGTNDGGHDYQSFLQDYPALLALLRRTSPNAILVCSGPWQPHTYTQDGDATYIQNFCQAQGGMFVDLQRLYAQPKYRWATRQRTLAWLANKTDPFLPNDLGMAAISSAFLAAIRTEIAQREALPPSPPIVAIIFASIGGFFITMVFALPVNDGRRSRRRHGRRSGQPDEAKRITRIGWEEAPEPAEAFGARRTRRQAG